MDLEMTYEQYKQYGQGKKFENLPDYSRYKKQQGWYEKVRSPKTGEFYQAEELIKRELVPEDWKPPRTKNGKPVRNPLKEVWEIYRIRAVDGSEWLKSRYMMTGLDSLGNEQNLAMIDPEMYNEVIPIYGQKRRTRRIIQDSGIPK
jgi:hypothetical protein